MVRLTSFTLALTVFNALLLQVHCIWKGYDVTNLLHLEAAGYKYFDVGGVSQMPLERILAKHGMNLARIRLNATDESLQNALKLAQRFKSVGASLYVDLHLAETWGDAIMQMKPKAWIDRSGHALTGPPLHDRLRSYVSGTLATLSKTGAHIAYVSLGNEISNGILFPDGKTQGGNYAGFAGLWASARLGVTDFVKATGVKPRVMLHLPNGWKDSVSSFFLNLFATRLVTPSMIDVVGLSMYADLNVKATLSNLALQMKTLESRWHLPSMIAETNWPVACRGNGYTQWGGGRPMFPLTEVGQLQWYQALIDLQKKNALRSDIGIVAFEIGWMSKPGAGGTCEDVLLFGVPDPRGDWHKAVARRSIGLFTA